jgi:hypothetical protein
VQPEESDFTWMTLNGITCAEVVVEGITPDLENHGVTSQQLEAHLAQRLTELGIKAVSLADARTTRGATQIKLRLVANRDAHGFYYSGVKLTVRQKIPLGNPAGGFVSQLVWTAGESGMIQVNEGGRVLDATDHLLESFARDFHRQNSGTPH